MYLITGALGQLGNELRLILGDKAEYIDREELDITDAKAVKEFFAGKSYDAIVNCAAYTAVDKAETEHELATKINVEGVKNLAQTGVPLLHISTDYVFSGKNYKPYVEEDEVGPESFYGETKMLSEKAALENASTAIVLRTSWLYSQFGNNFVKSMRNLGSERDTINVVCDQIGTPTNAKDLSEVIVKLLEKMELGTKEIYNFSNEGICSWYDFATEIMKLSNLKCKVMPIESKDYPTAAKRPFYSVLNKSKIKNHLGITIRHWQEALAELIEDVRNGI